MAPKRPSEAMAGLRRAAAVPAAAPEVRSSAADLPAEVPQRPRPEKPVRFTLDLDREQHRFLKTYAAGIDAKAAEVMRALLDELQADPELATRVRKRFWDSLLRRSALGR